MGKVKVKKVRSPDSISPGDESWEEQLARKLKAAGPTEALTLADVAALSETRPEPTPSLAALGGQDDTGSKPWNLEEDGYDPHVRLWERQPGESPQAFAGFAVYRDMGVGRSLLRVRQESGKNRRLLERWSAKWQWVDRAGSYDNAVDWQSMKTREAIKVELARRMALAQAAASSASIQALSIPAIVLAQRFQDGDGKKFLQDMPIDELHKLVTSGMKALTEAAQLQRDVLSPFLPPEEKSLDQIPSDYLEGRQPRSLADGTYIPRLPAPWNR